MRNLTWLLVFGAFGGCQGCWMRACKPVVPDVDTSRQDTNRPDTADTAVEDTAPEPPCDFPEVEPNNSFDDASVFEIEHKACGEWSQPYDADFYAFTLPADDWLLVRASAESLGSRGDAIIVLADPEGNAVEVRDMDDHPDPYVVFPGSAGEYTVLITDEDNQGAEDGFFYELVAGTAKQPTSWDHEETEPNDDESQAMAINTGWEIYGRLDDADDQDWFRLHLPVGKQTVTFDVDGKEFGSAGDFGMRLYDAAGDQLEDAWYGADGVAWDPFLEYTSSGDEDVWLRVVDSTQRSGPAYWYVLKVSVEAR